MVIRRKLLVSLRCDNIVHHHLMSVGSTTRSVLIPKVNTHRLVPRAAKGLIAFLLVVPHVQASYLDCS